MDQQEIQQLGGINIFFPGKVQLNPPKAPANVQPVDVGNFTRAVTGESFVVETDAITNFPPNKITDLSAEINEEIVHLNWTAPGADFDQGTGEFCALLSMCPVESLPNPSNVRVFYFLSHSNIPTVDVYLLMNNTKFLLCYNGYKPLSSHQALFLLYIHRNDILASDSV